MAGAFQSNAFQTNAFQMDGTAVCVPAFQPTAFQTNAFQTCVDGAVCVPAFNTSAFQVDAFQTCTDTQPPSPSTSFDGGGAYDFLDPERFRRRRKKKGDEDETPAPREVVKIKTQAGETVTGIVEFEPLKAPQRAPQYTSPMVGLERRDMETRAAYRRRLKAIQQADDEWLLMN